MSQFKDKVALVTGSTAGLGMAIAMEFAERGTNVIVSGRREREGLDVVQKINAMGKGTASFCKADVSLEEDVKRLIQYSIATFGKLDYAVNNAAIMGETKKLADYSTEAYHQVMSVNLDGTFYCMKHQIPHLIESKGAMVNVSSISGHRGQKHGIAPYSASKHGIIGLTKCAALEYGLLGVRINAIFPAGMKTEMNDNLYSQYQNPEEAKRERDKAYALGRIADPIEVAKTVLWLCSDDASFITGAAIPVDGGKTA